MKKVLSLFLVLIMVFTLCSCGVKPTQPNSFVDDGESRFILVDEWKEKIGLDTNQSCSVVADKVTGVMYLIVYGGYHMAMTPLYCEDGSLMIYDTY